MTSDRRKFIRTRFRALGYAKNGRREAEFHTTDLSVDGISGYFNGDPQLESGSLVHLRIPALSLEGFAMLIRLEAVGRGRYEAGFHFDISTMHPAL